jgi:hypothetical protein
LVTIPDIQHDARRMSRIEANLRLILERIELVFAGHRDGNPPQRGLRPGSGIALREHFRQRTTGLKSAPAGMTPRQFAAQGPRRTLRAQRRHIVTAIMGFALVVGA